VGRLTIITGCRKTADEIPTAAFLTRRNLAGEAAVIRQTSNHDETIRKNENRAKVMSSVDMFSSGIGASYARKMVELESRGQGDQLNALDRVGREVGLKARALRRIINGETAPSLAVFGRIRAGYLNLCERHIERLRLEVETDKARYGDALFQDIDDEVKALAEKLRAAKENATKGR
jgi:hypothetical protein